MNADLETCITASCDIPPLPLVATKVVELLGNENVTAAQLTEVISRDLALATRVMNMANSAFYRRLEEIRELRSAIVILGMRTIRSIVYGASLKQMFSSSSFFDKLLWEHSVATAIAGTMLARVTGYPQVDEVMLAGLLHDLGKNILNNSMPERYQQVVERVYAEGLSYCEVETETFGFAHHHVGPLLVKHWNFPMNLGKVIYFHHEMGELGAMVEEQKLLVALVHLADLYCRKLGLGYREPDETIDIASSPALAILGLEVKGENAAGFEEKILQLFVEEKGRFE